MLKTFTFLVENVFDRQVRNISSLFFSSTARDVLAADCFEFSSVSCSRDAHTRPFFPLLPEEVRFFLFWWMSGQILHDRARWPKFPFLFGNCSRGTSFAGKNNASPCLLFPARVLAIFILSPCEKPISLLCRTSRVRERAFRSHRSPLPPNEDAVPFSGLPLLFRAATPFLGWSSQPSPIFPRLQERDGLRKALQNPLPLGR